jgi:hypothetical protein
MTKLIERLRKGCVTGNYEGLEFIEWSKSNDTMNEAADAIQRLQYIVTVLSISSLLLLLTVIILVNR